MIGPSPLTFAELWNVTQSKGVWGRADLKVFLIPDYFHVLYHTFGSNG